jgi:hypothetical protein
MLADEVTEAAVKWWKQHRPMTWSEATHLRNATVNTKTGSEKVLAVAVARFVGATREAGETNDAG